MKNYILRYGTISSVILVFLSLMPWLLFKDSLTYRSAEVAGYSAMIVSLSLVFFGIKHFRNEVNGGMLTFKEGMKVGSLITLIPAGVFFLYAIIYFFVLGEDYMVWALETQQATLSPESFKEFETQMNMFKEYEGNPLMYLFQGLLMFVTVFLIGFIISLLSSLVLKREVS